MRTEDLLDAIGGVDDELLQQSEKVKIKRTNQWKIWVPIAACLCLVLGLRWLVMSDIFIKNGSMNDSAAESAVQDSLANEESGEKGSFDNIYALSMTEPNEAISASRQVVIDIVKVDAEQVMKIEDGYTIFNASGEKTQVEFSYMYNMDHSGTRPIFIDEEGEVLGKAGAPIQVTVPANGQIVIKGQYEKTITDCVIYGCQFTNLDVTESTITINRDGNVETIEIDPAEDYYLE